MTGLHALHIIIGGIIIAVVIYRTKKGLVNKDKYTLTENAGLYWHLVDMIWIYLFPLFYLIH
jgi:cytochrome c oxidase subunit 3